MLYPVATMAIGSRRSIRTSSSSRDGARGIYDARPEAGLSFSVASSGLAKHFRWPALNCRYSGRICQSFHITEFAKHLTTTYGVHGWRKHLPLDSQGCL